MLSYIRDRLLSIQLKRDEKEIKIGFIIVGAIILFLLANVIFLNLAIVKNKSTSGNIILTPTPLATIYASASPTMIASPTPSPISSVVPKSSVSVIKDYFIPLGSGSNQAGDWTDVQGAQVTVDLGQYQDIKEIHLESSIDVPTANGTVSIRLYNTTDKHPVWNSEVTANANMGLYLVSSALTYDSGSKLYQVQIKTQLKVLANLSQSRIHVIVK